MTKKINKLNLISFVFIVDTDINFLIKRIKQILGKFDFKKKYEILIIDNGLNTEEKIKLYDFKIKFKNIRIISLVKKYNFDNALICALDNVIGDGVLILNPHNFNEKKINSLIFLLNNGNDIVIEKNPISKEKIKFFLKQLINLTNKFSSNSIYINLSNTYALSRKAVNLITSIRRKNRFFLYLTKSVGLNKIYYKSRLSDDFIKKFNKTNFLVFFIQTLDILISNSYKPLRITSLFSAFSSFLSFLFILYVFIVSLIKKNIVEGWLSTALVLGSMFFMLFLILTVLSEYILRILEEVKEEPLYFIEKEIDHSTYEKKDNDLNVFENLK